MNPDEEEARDRPGDPKKAEKRREQNRLAKKRSREKKKHDQVRNEGKAEEEKEREEVYQFARIWRYIDQWSGPRPGGLTLRLRDSWGTEVRGWSSLALGGVG